jgi:hypothetical protein
MIEGLKDFMMRLVQEDRHRYQKVLLRKLTKICGEIPWSWGILKIYGMASC